MGLKVEIKPSMDVYGLVHVHPGKVTGNGLRYTSEYYIALHQNGLLTQDDADEFFRVVEKCYVQIGLVKRHPKHFADSQEGPDDYTALLNAARRLKSPVLDDISTYWDHNRGIMNNVNPGNFTFSAWLGRRPQDWAHKQFCNNKRAFWFNEAWWAITIFTSAFKSFKNQDGWVLAWHLVDAMEGMDDKPPLCVIAAEFWRWKKGDKTIASILADYAQTPFFPDGWKWPVAKWFKD